MSEHHQLKPYFIVLLIKVYFLRLMALLEVALTDKLRPKPKDDVRIEKFKFPSRDAGRDLVGYMYTPVDLPEGVKPPVNINVHGSGFGTWLRTHRLTTVIFAFFGNSRWFCYQVAKQLQCIVIDVDYRKAPGMCPCQRR